MSLSQWRSKKENTATRRAHRKRCALFMKIAHNKQANESPLKKRVYKNEKLCYSIGEAERMLIFQLTRRITTGANGRNELQEQGFNTRRSEIGQEEFSANVYSGGKIDLVSIFSVFLMNDYGLGNQFIEIVHGKTGEDFLMDELRLFCMEML